MMTRPFERTRFWAWRLARTAALGLATLLAGCVVYPDYGGPGYGGAVPTYAGYGGYGGYGGVTSVTVYAPVRAYRGPEHHGFGGWRDSHHQAGGGRHVEPSRRREPGYGG